MNQNKQMIMNYYQNEILDYDKDFYNQYGIYVKPHGYSISSRKIESYIQIAEIQKYLQCNPCLLYTSPSPRDRQKSRMPSSA